jgi:hypothetical protein
MLRSALMFSRRSWLVGTALLAAGCLSPTLPLPPPSEPSVSSSESGLVRLTGSVAPESEVIALNHDNDLISGQYTTSGSYDFTIQAQDRDWLSLWYVNDTLESPATDFIVKLTPAAQ